MELHEHEINIIFNYLKSGLAPMSRINGLVMKPASPAAKHGGNISVSGSPCKKEKESSNWERKLSLTISLLRNFCSFIAALAV